MQAFVSSAVARVSGFARAGRARKVLWWIAGLIAAFAAIGFLVVPPIAKSKLEEGLSQALHRKVTVDTVRVNPFVPSFTVRGFAVREREGDALFASFDELYVNAAWSSIFRLAPVLDEITLAKPHLRVVRNADRTYNFQDLLDEFLARPKSEMPKFALFNIRLLDGRIDFDDRPENEKHAVTELRVGIPFISSLPAHAEIKVLPELAMKVNDAPLAVKAEALPFKDPHATNVSLSVDGFDLTRLTDYLPFKPHAKLRSALLDARLELAFEQPAGEPPQIKLRGGTAIRNLNVLDREDRPMLAWQRLGVEINELEPFAPRIDLKSVELEGTEVQIRRGKDGAINLAQLGPVPPARGGPQAPSGKNSGGTPMALKIERVALKSGKVRFIDQATAPVFEEFLEDVQLEGRGIDSEKGKRSEWTFSARSAAGETIKLAAGAIADPLAADGHLDIAGVKLKRYQPYIQGAADLEIDDGELDGGLAFAWGGKAAALKIADLTLALKSLRARLPGEKVPFVRLASLEMKGAGLDVAAQTANLGEIAVREVSANLRRGKDGKINLTRIARSEKTGAQGKRDGSQATATARPWRIDLGQASIERGSVMLEDLAIGEPVRISIAPIELKAQQLSTAKGQRGNVSVRATINKTGTLAASGPLTLDPLAARFSVAAKTIGFVPLQRYIDDKVSLAVTSGALSAKGTASFEMPPGGAVKASYKGDVDIADFASIDKRSTQDLLKWKALSLGGIDFVLEPMKVSLDQIALADFYARIILSAEGRLNLQDLAAAPGAADAPAPAAAQSQTSATEPQAQPRAGGKPPAAALPPNVRIGRITLQGGNVNFSDFYIKPNYSANLTGIAGAVTEVTPEKAGDVELRGKIDNAAPVEIAGRVNPLAADLFLDVKASAKDIELPPMSPYAVKYAGYGIQRGKLSMNVNYHIENRKLSAENNIYLDQLTFGERVESPSATKLPVTLAVALLKDRNGVIDINLPISGSLDDPEFSMGAIIVKVIVNLIVKATTAPFALLGSLFGGGEELAYLEFAPGSAALVSGDQRKLENLAKALNERPGLKLEVTGRVEAGADREGLKRASIDGKVKAQKFSELRRAGTAPASVDAVTVEPGEYEKYLQRAYGEEKFPKPRNVIGIAKTLPVAEMENLMLAHTQIAEDDLRLLANARAQAAKEWLVSEGKVPAERVFIIAPKLTAEDIKDKGKPTRADFALK